MTTTLSQRLREIAANIPTRMSMKDPGWSPVEVSEMIRSLAAQAEAMEAQAGELSDEFVKARAMEIYPPDEVNDGHPWYGHRRAIEDTAARQMVRHLHKCGYLRPLQAIGEQAPVAQANPIIGNVHERWHELGYGNTDRLHERFRGDPWRIFYAGWIEGRAPLVAQLKDNHRLFTEARDALAEYRDKHRSPISPEARDMAVEALEQARTYIGNTHLIDQALSALRGS